MIDDVEVAEDSQAAEALATAPRRYVVRSRAHGHFVLPDGVRPDLDSADDAKARDCLRELAEAVASDIPDGPHGVPVGLFMLADDRVVEAVARLRNAFPAPPPYDLYALDVDADALMPLRRADGATVLFCDPLCAYMQHGEQRVASMRRQTTLRGGPRRGRARRADVSADGTPRRCCAYCGRQPAIGG